MYEWGLIDLKRLHDDVEYWEQHDDPKQPDYDTRDIERVIADQPVVEAIPIEVLRDWQKQYGNKCTYGHIMRLVNLWEKERK